MTYVPSSVIFPGNLRIRKSWVFDSDATNAVQRSSRTPGSLTLEQNYPNPFNPSTTLKYGLQMDSRVKLHIYNVLGQQVAELVDAE